MLSLNFDNENFYNCYSLKNINLSRAETLKIDFFSKICKPYSNQLEIKEFLINNVINIDNNDNMNDFLSIIENNKKDLIIKNDNIIYQITSMYNQKNIIYDDNISVIDFGECENILKEKYNIPANETIIILKIHYYIEGFYIPIIEYELFHPNNKMKLDLNYCQNTNINISYKVFTNESNLFKHDPNDEYYNNKCYPYTTEIGTDISLYNRKKEYNYNNMSLCEHNCSYSYNKETKNALCQCKVKNKFELLSEVINKNKDELLNNFIDIRKTANLDIIKCYKLLFTKNGLIYNIGSYIILSIIFIHIVGVIIFLMKGFPLLYEKIQKIINHKKVNTNLNNSKGQKKSKKIIKKNKLLNINSIQQNNLKKRKKKFSIQNINSKAILRNNQTLFKNNNQSNDKLNTLNINNNIIGNDNKILPYTDSEMNSFNYKDALKYDKRTYLQYYFSLLKTKHLLIFAFLPMKDYNSMIIKICLFFISFSLYYTINALFFTDETMNKIYEDHGEFNFIFQIPQILYSTLISSVISFFIKFLSLSERNIISIKNVKVSEESSDKIKYLLNCIYIQFYLFFILNFLLLILFWFYLSIFCVVYKNTQLYLIKDTIISFIVSLLYPLGLNFLPGIFRIPAIKVDNKKNECLYKISKIIQLI